MNRIEHDLRLFREWCLARGRKQFYVAHYAEWQRAINDNPNFENKHGSQDVQDWTRCFQPVIVDPPFLIGRLQGTLWTFIETPDDAALVQHWRNEETRRRLENGMDRQSLPGARVHDNELKVVRMAQHAKAEEAAHYEAIADELAG